MKFMEHRLLAAAFGLFASGLFWTGSGHEVMAQTPLLSYAAKFVCGTRTTERGVVRGLYETSVNVHNPHFTQVVVSKKAVIALPQRQPPIRPSAIREHLLLPDYAIGMDCKDIRSLFAPAATGFIEGFVVVYTGRAQPLDVIGVYTERHRTGTSADVTIYDAESIAVERVTPVDVVAP